MCSNVYMMQAIRTCTLGIEFTERSSEILCFAAQLGTFNNVQKEKEQITTPISLGVVCCRVYLRLLCKTECS